MKFVSYLIVIGIQSTKAIQLIPNFSFAFKGLLIICLLSAMYGIPLFAQGSSGNKVFTLPQNLDVDPTRGTAVSSIPISVPPGRGGIQPNITLAYNSSSPNGSLGMGWMMELGKVERSTKYGVPSYTSEDTFVLTQAGSQQELINNSGNATEFRARFGGAFLKIEFVDGSFWKVTDKNGVKYFFGQSATSREYDPGNPSKVYAWRLDHVEDIHTNYMAISYTANNGKLYPSQISYTGNSTSNMNPYAHVHLHYSTGRTDVGLSYITGYQVNNHALRLDDIEITAHDGQQDQLIRRYEFTYTQDPDINVTLLSEVKQVGSDGITELPPMTYSYSQNYIQYEEGTSMGVNAASLQTEKVRFMNMDDDNLVDILEHRPGHDDYAIHWNQGNNTFAAPVTATNSQNLVDFSQDNVKLLDLNADGFVDFLFGPSTYAVTLNNGIDGFEPTFELDHRPDEPIASGQVSFVDMDGDGYVDMLWAEKNSYKIYFNDGTAHFDSPIVATNSPDVSTTNDNVKFADFNGDGLLDVVYWEDASGSLWLNNGENGYEPPLNNLNFPAEYDLSSGYLSLVDLNGDGLTDLLEVPNILNAPFYFWFNDGNNNVIDRISAVNSNTIHPGHIRILDYNNDGRQDVLYGEPYKTWQVFINNGVNGFWPGQDLVAYPGGGNTVNDPKFAFADVNGDGLVDLVNGTGTYHVRVNKTDSLSPKGSVLIEINNSIGGITELSYVPVKVGCLLGAQYRYSFNPVVFNTIKSLTRTVFNESFVTQYEYKNCFWHFKEREFRGFGFARVIDAEGHYSETDYLQDNILKGRIRESRSFDANDTLLAKSVNTWDSEELETDVHFVYLKRVDSFSYENGSSGKRTAKEFFYDESPQWGNLSTSIDYGEVDVATGVDVGNDIVSIETDYLNHPAGTNRLIGLTKQVRTYDAGGVKQRETSFYYDYNTNINAPPVQGLLTKKRDWGGNGAQAVHPVTEYSYDDLGNLITTVDARGGITTITYDSQVSLFPIITTNARGHQVYNEYYGIDGVPLISADGYRGNWGQLKSTTDPNEQQGGRVYDALGRPVKSVSPLDTTDLPTTETAYDFTNDCLKVTTHQRVHHGVSTTISTFEFYDGFGRLVQSKTTSAIEGQYVVSGQSVYNDRGLPTNQFLPFFSTNPVDEIEDIDLSRPHITLAYDAQGRVITRTNPDNTYASVIHEDWKVTTIDENGHKQVSFFDARGRLIEKQEFLGADGRSVHYPASAYTLYASTRYEYDSQGNLIKTTDAHGNVTTISYDKLGRKISMNDPDMGLWTYEYDNNGNLIAQIDAKGQRIEFDYDELNRLTDKDVAATTTVVYTYDDLLMNFSQGRLNKAAYGADHATFDYDELGREVTSNKLIDGVLYTVNRNYDALNRLTSVEYPDTSEVHYAYNQAGQIIGIANASLPDGYNEPGGDSGGGDDTYVPPTYMNTPRTYFKMNEDSSSPTVVDSGSGGNNGSQYSGGTNQLAAAGLLNGAFEFDGPTSGYCVDVTSFGSDLMDDQAGSFSFWVKDSQSWMPVFHLYNNHPTGGSNAWIRVSPEAVSWIYEDAGSYSGRHASIPDDGAWHHIVLVQDGLDLKAFIDGREEPMAGQNGAQGKWFGDMTSPISKASIGCFTNASNWQGYYFDGRLDDFHYYDYALTQSEIDLLYANGEGTEETTPMIDPGSGTPPTGGSSTLPEPFLHFKVNDDASSTTVSDEGYGTNDGFSVLSTTNTLSTNGLLNKAFEFDGPTSGNCVNVSTAASQIVADQVGTFSFWVNNVTGWKPVFHISTNSGDAQAGIRVSGEAVSWLIEDGSGGYTGVHAPYDGTDGLWHHLVVMQDGQGVKAFVDGQEIQFVGSNSIPTAWFGDMVAAFGNGGIGCRIGSEGSLDSYFIGKVDDFRYYKEALTPEMIGSLYNEGNGTEESAPPYIPPAGSGGGGENDPDNIYVVDVLYNAAGQIAQIEYGNGTIITYTYNPLTLRLQRIHTLDPNLNAIQDLNYSYDSLGNIVEIVDNVNTASQTFAYDALNRLIHAEAPSTYGVKTYDYDEIGNLKLKDGVIYTYGENGAGPHAVTSLSDGSLFDYDANGNMTVRVENGVMQEYTYDIENRLISIIKDGVLIAEYTYDGDGGRVKKEVYNGGTSTATKFVGSLYEESGSRQTRHIFLGDQRIGSITNGDLTLYFADHLGGANAVTNEAGEVKEITEYQPFGKIARRDRYGSSEEVAWYYFTGQYKDDESELMFYNARYYDPNLGRFITADTIVPYPNDLQSFNRYTYVSNNPVNMVDPSGHIFGFIAAVISKVTLSGVVKGAIAGSFVGGAVAAATGGDIGTGFLTGAIGGAIFGGVGDLAKAYKWGIVGKTVAHAGGGALSGGINTVLYGGDVVQGVLIGGVSAGVNQYLGHKFSFLEASSSDGAKGFAGAFFGRSVVGAALGGIFAEATGGNFGEGAEKGAVYSGIAFSANDFMHTTKKMWKAWSDFVTPDFKDETSFWKHFWEGVRIDLMTDQTLLNSSQRSLQLTLQGVSLAIGGIALTSSGIIIVNATYGTWGGSTITSGLMTSGAGMADTVLGLYGETKSFGSYMDDLTNQSPEPYKTIIRIYTFPPTPK